MSDRQVQIKLVAIADVQLKQGQEIDATLTVPERGIFTSEIASGLVLMMTGLLPDPTKPTGWAAIMAEEVQRKQ